MKPNYKAINAKVWTNNEKFYHQKLAKRKREIEVLMEK
tara:strand:+ start:419 stop:532 length:114 start_codon:yes stop_codon:yes gene_type:complete